LYFQCDDGSDISYQNTANEACGGSLDKDMQAGDIDFVRGSAGSGQVENISVGSAVNGHTYSGRVRYYGGSGNAEFQVIFSGVDDSGHLHVYGQEHVATFDTAGVDHPYSFTYTDPDAGGK